MAVTLYNLKSMKQENSVLRSVFFTDRKTSEGYQIVEVEPYDQTFLNAVKRDYDKMETYIMKEVYKFMDRDVWLIFYTDHGKREFLINDYYMKEFYKLVS